MSDMIYGVKDRVPLGKNILFALQQYLAIITATILVPIIADSTGLVLSQSSALIGAGVGTIIYLICTRFKSPVILGSSFSFILPLTTAVSYGYFGVLLGALFSGLVYLILALVVKLVGTNWINKIMPPVIIGPTVALIGFNLASSAIKDIMNTTNGAGNYSLLSIAIGLLTFFVVIMVSCRGKKLKMYPFVVGIIAGYVVSALFTVIGLIFDIEYLQLVDFGVYSKIGNLDNWLPNITFVGALKEGFGGVTSFGDVVTIFVLFVPISLVAFAEHIADHKNIGSIIGADLLKDPGLHWTLFGDGMGSILGATFGGCPNTTYGESIGCVALSKNASTRTILLASIMCIVSAFIYPIIVFAESIPACVVGGVSIALYGFISVSGLRMIKDVDLNESKNLFVVSAIFICGIGGLELHFGNVIITNIACALIVGIISNVLLNISFKKKDNVNNGQMLENQLQNKNPQEIKNQNEKDI